MGQRGEQSAFRNYYGWILAGLYIKKNLATRNFVGGVWGG
jgi:hypothetical protein